MYACMIGNENIIEKLIELKADINKENKNGITPIMYAIDIGNEAIIEKLIELKADINKENKDGITPLIYSQVKNKNIINILTNANAELNTEHVVNFSTPIARMSNNNIDKSIGKYYIYIDFFLNTNIKIIYLQIFFLHLFIIIIYIKLY